MFAISEFRELRISQFLKFLISRFLDFGISLNRYFKIYLGKSVRALKGRLGYVCQLWAREVEIVIQTWGRGFQQGLDALAMPNNMKEPRMARGLSADGKACFHSDAALPSEWRHPTLHRRGALGAWAVCHCKYSH